MCCAAGCVGCASVQLRLVQHAAQLLVVVVDLRLPSCSLLCVCRRLDIRPPQAVQLNLLDTFPLCRSPLCWLWKRVGPLHWKAWAQLQQQLAVWPP